MKTCIAIYEKSGEIEPYDVRVITCPHCQQAEELPVDEQRWHYQHFDMLSNSQELWLYRCCECKELFEVNWAGK